MGLDRVGVMEKLASFVSLPDAGLVGTTREEELGPTPAFELNGLTPAMAERPLFDLSGLCVFPITDHG